MKNYFHKITAGIILVAIVAMVVLPAATLLAPQKAEAQTSCVSGIIMGFVNKLIGGVMSVLSVPVSNISIQNSAASSAGSNFGTWVSDCIIKPLVKNLVKQLIHQFLTSIVDWINSGFDGSGPRFVSDPASFFADIADRAIGQVVMGTDLNFLCSPFRANIRLSLGLNYWSGGFRERIGCTLSDIQQNVQNAFMGGQWDPNGDGGGWQNWINLTTIPQNNPYGAFLIAQDEINIRIANQQWVAGKEADWGSGFLSTKRCVEYITDEEELAMFDAYGGDPCLRYETVTPGKTIQEGLSKSLGAEVDEYVAAEDLDAIFGALMNQMIGSVFTATGLFSGNRSNPNNYREQFLRRQASGYYDYEKPTTGGMAGVSCNDIQNYTPISRGGVQVVQHYNGSQWEDTSITAEEYQQAADYCARNPSMTAVEQMAGAMENQIGQWQNQQSQNACPVQTGFSYTNDITANASAFGTWAGAGGSGGPPPLAIDGTTMTFAQITGGWLSFTFKQPVVLNSVRILMVNSANPLRSNSEIEFYATDLSSSLIRTVEVKGATTDLAINLSAPDNKIQKMKINQVGNLYVSEVTFNRYETPVVNWQSENAVVGESFDAIAGITARNCNNKTIINRSDVQITKIQHSSGDNLPLPPSGGTITFPIAGNYYITYVVNDGIADSNPFQRMITVSEAENND